MTDDARPLVTAPPQGVRTTRRRGRASATKAAVLRDLGPAWTLPADDPAGPWTADGGRPGPLLVDIGVGSGEATRAWAASAPEARVLAIELHRPGLAKLLTALDAEGPANVRVVEADALELLAHLDDASVAGIRVLFPDPWPKRRHVERRMVDRAFVGLAARVLEPGGTLHLATDWADYADHMRSMVATDPRFELQEGAGRPDRPVTAYEQRGLDVGRRITDLVYRFAG
ncbi:MAG: tRNA (guanosine(46)-N7)-methyltransferase TrmB [Aquihabitans sp.]